MTEWRSAYVQLVIGNEPISLPRAVRVKKLDGLWIFDKSFRTYPSRYERPGPVHFVLYSWEDQELARKKLSDKAWVGLTGNITVAAANPGRN